ncbi:class I SAM-dependent methyltransferase|uniref:Macrocin-O-methyltransferase (TylF) n=1 Tax=Dendrosporobacter quercicolus TaxID=146817 RepID=A0A1G9WV51_9FIRM|nr:TylF/MycF/NovP-related O-methyltransferase [Dendrosporobacter quercicolus]NSL49225.1 class I SAM-dependent methyltransferase [Dendrosporobacter quercicolus DSM 1736]SDM88442.1 Macrocin-O-methyltransferase (TylF) [Dendrosporobacter quercicolus]
MIQLPNFSNPYEYENNFYFTCDSSRLGKIFAHYELFKKVLDVPGEIVEFGVFKGASFLRLAMIRELLGAKFSKKIIGFDTFGEFPETNYQEDVLFRKKFLENAGTQSISKEQLEEILQKKEILRSIELIQGNILHTLPNYIMNNPHFKISFLNLDTDIYEPAICVLENCWNRIVRGGVLVLDDYCFFAGENKAVDDFFEDKDVQIKCFAFAKSPSYIIKK